MSLIICNCRDEEKMISDSCLYATHKISGIGINICSSSSECKFTKLLLDEEVDFLKKFITQINSKYYKRFLKLADQVIETQGMLEEAGDE